MESDEVHWVKRGSFCPGNTLKLVFSDFTFTLSPDMLITWYWICYMVKCPVSPVSYPPSRVFRPSETFTACVRTRKGSVDEFLSRSANSSTALLWSAFLMWELFRKPMDFSREIFRKTRLTFEKVSFTFLKVSLTFLKMSWFKNLWTWPFIMDKKQILAN